MWVIIVSDVPKLITIFLWHYRLGHAHFAYITFF